MRRVLRRWLDQLLGERCVCGQRVYPRDLAEHERREHAGDDVQDALREAAEGHRKAAAMWLDLAGRTAPTCGCRCHLSDRFTCPACRARHASGSVR